VVARSSRRRFAVAGAALVLTLAIAAPAAARLLPIATARAYLASTLQAELTHHPAFRSFTITRCWRVNALRVNCDFRVNTRTTAYCLATAAIFYRSAASSLLALRTVAAHCHTPTTAPPPSGAPPPQIPPGGYRYPGQLGSGHSITSISGKGTVHELVVLEDGSLWQISSLEDLQTSLWLSGNPIIVAPTSDDPTFHPYTLINTALNTSAAAEYIGGFQGG
jgi:hypothetical protein